MAADDKKPDPKGQAEKPGARGAGGTARKPVTIDLEAREVKGAAGPGPAASAGAKADEAKKPGPAPAASATSGATAAQAGAGASGAKTGADAASASAGKAADSGSGEAKADGMKPTAAKASDPKKADAGISETKAPETKATETKTPDAKASETKAGVTAGAGSSASAASSAGATSAAHASGPAPTKPSPEEGRGGSAGFGSLLAASLVGAVVALGGAFGAQQAGFLGGTDASGEARAALQAAQSRIAGLEERIASLADRQDASAGVAPELGSLKNRLDSLEGDIKAAASSGADQLSEAAAARLGDVEKGLSDLRGFVASGGAGETAGLASLQQSVSGLESRIADLGSKVEALGEPAPAPDLSGIETRLDALETASQTLSSLPEAIDGLRREVTTTREETGKLDARFGSLETALTQKTDELSSSLAALTTRVEPIEAQMGDAGARELASRAIAVTQLKAAMDRGAPFETELAAVAGLVAEGTDLAPLAAKAATGVPTRTELRARFGAAARAMSATLDRPADGDMVDTLLSNARSLVSIRTPGESGSATPDAALGRMEARVDAGDLAGALEAYQGLPEPAKAAGADWVADAKARLAADALVDGVTRDVLKSLGDAAR